MADQSTISYPHVIERDLRLDLFRGIGLWMIFLDHIPQDVLAYLTLRNYGFSDAAEMFVFISGYLVGFIYGPIVRAGEFLATLKRLLLRAWQMYVAHILLFLIFVAQIARTIRKFDNPMYQDEFNVHVILEHPDILIGQALTLRYKPVNLDVLPLYITLVLASPLIVWCLVRRPNWTLLASGALYTAAHLFQWNLPSYPPGATWYFNPFAWQFLFVFAAWCGVGGLAQIRPLIQSRAALILSVVWLVIAFVIVMSWNIPYTSQWIKFSISKTYLDPVRLIHALALALVVTRYVPRDWPPLQSSYARPLIVCGQHSLPIFCVGVFLSFAGHWMLVQYGNRYWQQLGIAAAGILVMIAVAWFLNKSAKVANLFVHTQEHGAKVQPEPAKI